MTDKILITPNEETATAINRLAEATQKTPAEVALEIITQHFEAQRQVTAEKLQPAAQPIIPPKGLTEKGRLAQEKIAAGEQLSWDDLAGVFSSGRLNDDAARLEEILEEEWLIDEG